MWGIGLVEWIGSGRSGVGGQPGAEVSGSRRPTVPHTGTRIPGFVGGLVAGFHSHTVLRLRAILLVSIQSLFYNSTSSSAFPVVFALFFGNWLGYWPIGEFVVSSEQIMTRKVIIDCDMGTDDAVALCMALFDDGLDILAVTATEGCVTAEQATRNLQAIVGVLDPDRHPRLGSATSTDNAPAVNTTYLYGDDGLGNTGFAVSELQHMMPAEKLIVDCVRAHPGDVTVICLGPYTNLARAFRRDPLVAELIDRVVMTGGSIQGIGNITQAAEFNCYFDPHSTRRYSPPARPRRWYPWM